jgi:hypothetical protein
MTSPCGGSISRTERAEGYRGGKAPGVVEMEGRARPISVALSLAAIPSAVLRSRRLADEHMARKSAPPENLSSARTVVTDDKSAEDEAEWGGVLL